MQEGEKMLVKCVCVCVCVCGLYGWGVFGGEGVQCKAPRATGMHYNKTCSVIITITDKRK